MTIRWPATTLAAIGIISAGCGADQKPVPLPTETPRQAPAQSAEQVVNDRYIAFYSVSNPTYTDPSSKIRPFYSEWGTGDYLSGLINGTIEARKSHTVPRGIINVRITKTTVTDKTATIYACLDFSGYRLINSKTGKSVTDPIKGDRPVKATLQEGGDKKWRISSEAPGSHSC